jgi:antirestriction protein
MTMTATQTSARVYVGTYGKYAAGSIKGAWLNLEDYADKEEFLTACRVLHADESDPELMFQDYEGFPSGFYSESCIDGDLWDWMELDDEDRDMLEAYQRCMDDKATIEDARYAYCGKYDSERDFAESWHDEIGDIDACPKSLRFHIDWDSVVVDMKASGDFMFHRMNGDVYVFRGN